MAVMGVRRSVEAAAGLLEREAELARIDRLIAGAASGEGGLVLVEGPAGIGKTALIDVACALARGRCEVFRARGSQLEREFAFGIVRQLFEVPLAGCSAQQRRGLFAGAARLAADMLAVDRSRGGSQRAPPAGDPLFAVVHGLYWLTVNWSERQPLVLVVDDAHWADAASLRFLGYLAGRLEGASVLVIVGSRRGEGECEFLDSTLAPERFARLEPAALSADGVSRLVRRFRDQADEQFCLACHTVSGGNPFLVQALLAELRRAGVEASAASAARIAALRPQAVTLAVLARLRNLPAAAGELARAVAVLGAGAQLEHARALAGVDEESAAGAIAALRACEVLALSGLEFVHQLVAGAVYESIAPSQRALMHLRAARVLAAQGASSGAVASHLLRVEPGGAGDVVRLLRAAACGALADGAPVAAVRCLRRALDEPPDSRARTLVLGELGAAEATARDPQAYEHLLAAYRLAETVDERARLAALLGNVCYFTARFAEGYQLISTVIDELGDEAADRGLLAPLEYLRSHIASLDARFVGELKAREPLRRAIAQAAGPPGRSLLIFEACWRWQQGGHADRWRALLDQGLDNGRFIAEGHGDSPAAALALACTVLSDELARAERLLGDMFLDAKRRGSIAAHATALAWSSALSLRAGNLSAATDDGHAALELCERHQLCFMAPFAAAFLSEALLERGQPRDAEQVISSAPLDTLAGTIAHALCLVPRARVRLALGRRAQAIEDLNASGATFQALLSDNPNGCAWRSTLALALGPEHRERALALAHEELATARAIEKPRAIGVALRAGGLLERGETQIELLRESVRALERSHAQLELARSLTDLGAALRRHGHRSEARDPLRHGLDLADACGARTIADRARQELIATGARPRRERITGSESLTAAERRVAELAAHGMSNREIAQNLFITISTVARHLTHTYQKLAITTRDELAEKLTEAKRAPRSPTTS